MKKIYSLILGCALVTMGFSQNLLTNPGFETGSIDAWSKGPTSSYTEPVIVTTDVHSGANSAGYTSVSKTTGFYQNVSVTEGKTYVISFWYKIGGTGNGARLWSIYKDSGNGAVYTTATADTDEFRTNNGYLGAVSEWTQYKGEMLAGAGSVSLDVAIRVYTGASNALFDDFEVVDKSNLAVSEVRDFEKQVKMNTIVRDELRLQLPERSTVNIYSIEGKLVSSNRLSDGGSINTQSLTAGTYIVTVDNGTTRISKKIIKQ